MRVQIPLPENFQFEYEIVIQPEHENEGGHLAHDKVVTLVGDCRDAWFSHLGFAGCRIGQVSIVNTDLMLMYIAQAYHGEQLVMKLAFDDMNKYGGDLLIQALRKQDKQEVFRAKSGFVFFNYQTEKVEPVPETFIAAVRA